MCVRKFVSKIPPAFQVKAMRMIIVPISIAYCTNISHLYDYKCCFVSLYVSSVVDVQFFSLRVFICFSIYVKNKVLRLNFVKNVKDRNGYT